MRRSTYAKRKSLRRNHHRNGCRRWNAGLPTGPHRQADSIAGARRLRSARKRQLESPRWSTSRASIRCKEVWRDRDGKSSHPHTNYCVGGNTKFYGAALFRLRREDFGETSSSRRYLTAHGRISYDELEPYYTKAEQMYHVHGKRGEDPTEPPASAPYPHPAVSHEPRIQQLSDDFAQLGLKPFHTPLGIMLDEKNPHTSKCIRCNTCDGFPCLVHTKSDAQVLGVDPALQYPNVDADDRRLRREAGDKSHRGAK